MAARPPSLRAVVAFEAAARHQSFAKAADELNLTHSAVSHAVRGLEARVGHALFDRPGRAVALTVEGERLAERIRLGLSLLSDALEGAPEPRVMRLVVGAPREIAHRMLSHRLGRFQALHPAVQIELRLDVTAAALSAGDIDLVIGREPGASPAFASRQLVRQRLFPVASPAWQRGLDAHALPAEALIEALECPWALWFGRLGRRGPVGPPAITVDDEGLAVAMAKAGAGVALARSALVQDDLRAGSLVRVGSSETPDGALHFVWNVRTAKSAPAQAFMAWLSDDLATAETPAPAATPARFPRPVGGSSSVASGPPLAAAYTD